MISTRELFAKHSLRCTQQRMAVYETLCVCNGHPTAEEIFRLVRPRTRRLSLATVYNALDALTTAGLVQRMPTTDGTCRYDADTTNHLHVCFDRTAEIHDVPRALGSRLLSAIPPEVLDEISRELGVEIEGISVQLMARSVERN